MTRRADALLFDLGNVIFEFDLNLAFARWAEYASCDVSIVRARFTIDEACRRHEIGAISDSAYFASLRTSLGIDLSDAQFLDGWNAIYLDEVPGISAALEHAAANLPIYAFSNTNRAHEPHWSQRYAETLKHFRRVFVSSTIGLRKPDAAAFRFVAREIGVAPDRILFFDDNLANVEGARACGFQAAHVETPRAIIPAVTDALRE